MGTASGVAPDSPIIGTGCDAASGLALKKPIESTTPTVWALSQDTGKGLVRGRSKSSSSDYENMDIDINRKRKLEDVRLDSDELTCQNNLEKSPERKKILEDLIKKRTRTEKQYRGRSASSHLSRSCDPESRYSQWDHDDRRDSGGRSGGKATNTKHNWNNKDENRNKGQRMSYSQPERHKGDNPSRKTAWKT
jgi:hypothetical protein